LLADFPALKRREFIVKTKLVVAAHSGERTRLECWFRRLAESNFFLQPTPANWRCPHAT
jgi:hypothetical protein